MSVCLYVLSKLFPNSFPLIHLFFLTNNKNKFIQELLSRHFRLIKSPSNIENYKEAIQFCGVCFSFLNISNIYIQKNLKIYANVN